MKPSKPANARVEALLDLSSKRFPELPSDCGQQVPGVLEVPEWHDWTQRPTTPDQLRIESYLDRLDLTGRSIFHIGIGNSSLAMRFAKRAGNIVGTTVEPAEAAHGRALGLPNYRTILHNKYSGASDAFGAKFDFIIDNNPTSFCCCVRHLAAMLEFYRSSLAPASEVVTDRRGLAWTISSQHTRRWSFSFADLAQVARPYGLQAYRISSDIYVLRHMTAPPPALRVRAGTALLLLRCMVVAKIRRPTNAVAIGPAIP